MRLVSLAAVLALLGTACSLQDDFAIPEPAGAAERGGVLRVAIGPVGSIDPTNAYEPNGRLVVSTMCDTLLSLDPVTAELVAGIADKWTLSDVGRGFTFRLQKDVRFHDGAVLSSQDVNDTIFRLASEEFASLQQDLTELITGAHIVSGRVESENEADREKLAGVRSRDAQALEMTVFSRMPDYLRILTDPATAPLPRTGLIEQPERFSTDPICVGPYELAEPWEGGDQLRLVRNAAYNPVNPAYTSGGAGYVDEIVFRIYATPEEQVEAFLAGEVDITSVPIDEVQRIPDDDLVVGSAQGIEFVGVPADGGVWAAPAARIALSLAIDRQRIADQVYEGVFSPATSFYPPALGESFHRPDACNVGRLKAEYGDDISLPEELEGIDLLPVEAKRDEARLLLDAVGIEPSETPLRFAFNDEGNNAALAREVARMWKSAFPGLEVELEPLSWREFLQRASSNEGLDSAFRLSWAPDYPGPDQYVTPLFTTSGIGQGNFAHYSNSALEDGLHRFARAVESEEDLVVEYHRVEDQLCADMPMIPVVHAGRAWAVDTDRFASANDTFVHRGTGQVLLRELFDEDLT